LGSIPRIDLAHRSQAATLPRYTQTRYNRSLEKRLMTKTSRLRFSAIALLALAGCSLSAVAATVTGTVTNKTINKAAGGDDVVLIAFAQGMQEAARTKTDAKGHYSIEVPDNGMHLIRVEHQ